MPPATAPRAFNVLLVLLLLRCRGVATQHYAILQVVLLLHHNTSAPQRQVARSCYLCHKAPPYHCYTSDIQVVPLTLQMQLQPCYNPSRRRCCCCNGTTIHAAAAAAPAALSYLYNITFASPPPRR
jgi:hypothetical protein